MIIILCVCVSVCVCVCVCLHQNQRVKICPPTRLLWWSTVCFFWYSSSPWPSPPWSSSLQAHICRWISFTFSHIAVLLHSNVKLLSRTAVHNLLLAVWYINIRTPCFCILQFQLWNLIVEFPVTITLLKSIKRVTLILTRFIIYWIELDPFAVNLV